jgi:hypothetical protein
LYQVLVSTPSVTIFLNAHSLQVTEDLIPTWPENALFALVTNHNRNFIAAVGERQILGKT